MKIHMHRVSLSATVGTDYLFFSEDVEVSTIVFVQLPLFGMWKSQHAIFF